ncbi:hypothetical protein N7931_08450 [Catenovulum sp. 2E275]|uniref:hypothetical protein n=1 Tax=Catenovulum sp. 2E275 TaxID=2980497 RepID=UPI0021D3042A|nr:hypothetical protein [Catenovulum sp. 2E275]MCU4675660.1 hypothetical protein [Catenovulum sp. 2E275]
MKEYELSFAKLIIHDSSLVEVIINSGVLVDLPKVDEYHSFLLNYLTAPFNVLINKVNSYSYDEAAIREIGTLREINALAFLTYNKISFLATQSLFNYSRSRDWKCQCFQNKEKAFEWLKRQT